MQRAFGRARLIGGEVVDMAIKRRTIGAHDLAFIAAIEKNVGMIEWRIGADAHEFLRADLYGGNTGVIVKVRNMMIGHEQPSG